ncbi:stromelysin-3-like [Asterias rubens]|uniref:stromelysin-3-like n=1 Tax=Asterias rubens TaxID=7604 RepID=UPI001455AB5E|nr:stromelysin-3-like [Asterias rubens]
MRLLSLYAVIAVALMVCCLMPSDGLSKPVKKKHGKRGQGAPGDRREGSRGERRRGHGKDRPEEEEPEETTPSNVDEETDVDGEFESGPLFDSEQTDTEPGEGQNSEGGEEEEEEKHGRGNGKPHKNNTTRGWQNRRENMPIRPQYRPSNSKPKTGPLELSGVKVDVKEKEAMRKAVGYMSAYGYMRKMDDDDFNTDKISAKKMKKSIKMMQKFMGLKETGELDEMTMMMMEKPRCGVADMTPPSTKGNTTRSNYTGGPLDFSHFGQRWDKLDITFRILNYPRTMSAEETRETLLRAFKVWSDITPLTFTEIHGAQYADFYLKFGYGNHGDSYPFDGPGGVLAHAFLPKSNSGDIEGDVHFDDDEPFSYATYDGTNLFQVAAHEIGHSLGMHHSSDPSALMAPFYPGYQPTFVMPYDDLSGIQSLYGSKQNPQPYPFPYPNPPINEPTQAPVPSTTRAPPATVQPNPTQSPTQPPAQTPTTPVSTPTDPCPSIVFDATTFWRGELFSFTGNKYGRIRDYTILSREGGSNAQYFFQNFPGDIDAVYEDPVTYKLFMFKGSNYYVYNGLIRESGPTPITNIDPSLPSNIDAVVTWAADKKTYIFKDELVWRYDELTRSVDPDWPYRIDEVWRGVPNGVAAAFHNEDSHLTYFLVGKDYYRYDDLYAEVDVGPRDYTEDYFGCF